MSSSKLQRRPPSSSCSLGTICRQSNWLAHAGAADTVTTLFSLVKPGGKEVVHKQSTCRACLPVALSINSECVQPIMHNFERLNNYSTYVWEVQGWLWPGQLARGTPRCAEKNNRQPIAHHWEPVLAMMARWMVFAAVPLIAIAFGCVLLLSDWAEWGRWTISREIS